MSSKEIILTELRKLQALHAASDPANDPFSTSSLLRFFITAIDMQLVDRPAPSDKALVQHYHCPHCNQWHR